jgi:hypothetical protein
VLLFHQKSRPPLFYFNVIHTFPLRSPHSEVFRDHSEIFLDTLSTNGILWDLEDPEEGERMTGNPNEVARVVYIPAQVEPSRQDEIDLLELGQILWRKKWFIIGFVLLSTLAAFVVTNYLLTPLYQAKAVLRPTEASGPIITAYLNSTQLKRKLVANYDLLPILYADRWDDENKQWLVDRPDQIPTTELVLAEGKIPFHLGGNYTLVWEGADPAFNVLMLKRIIRELDLYLQNDFVSDAQVQMTIFEQELAPLTVQYEGVWDQFWGLDKINLAKIDLLGEYTRLKNKISDLKSQDALSRRFVVTGEPIAAMEPFFPKTTLIVALTFLASGMLPFFLYF